MVKLIKHHCRILPVVLRSDALPLKQGWLALRMPNAIVPYVSAAQTVVHGPILDRE